MFDRLLKMLLDKENLNNKKLNKSTQFNFLPFLSGEVARIINASIEPPRNGGSSFYIQKK